MSRYEEKRSVYEIYHTVDASGARCAVPYGWYDGGYDCLSAAIREMEVLERAGACSYIRRRSDGARLTPNLTWTDADGSELSGA